MSFVQATDLTRTFDLSDPFIVRAISRTPKRILTAVDKVSFSIEKGTTYALVGESGSGKSTIAKMAVGLLKPTDGSLLVDGMNLNDPKLAKEETLALRRRIQMVFQSPYASLNPRWKVKDILCEPIKAFKLIESPKAQIDRVHELLEQVGTHLSSKNGPSHWTRSCGITGRRRPESSSNSCPSTLSQHGCLCPVPSPHLFAIRSPPKMSDPCRGTCLWSVGSAPWCVGMRSPW